MASSNGDDPLINVLLAAAFENQNLRTMLLLFGAVLVATGIILMSRHFQQWQTVRSKKADKSLLLFEFRKFRRRCTIACLMAISGCAMMAIYWLIDVKFIALMSLTIFATLVGVLGLAILDLMSVGIRRYAEDDDAARQKLVKEYHRLKQKVDERNDSAPDA